MAVSNVGRQSFRCRCYFTDNFFLKEYGIHVKYLDDKQLFRDYGNILRQNGCNDEEKRQTVLNKIQKELQRRQNVGRESVRRKEIILNSYHPPNRDIYTLKDSFLDPKFLRLVEYSKLASATAKGLLQYMKTEQGEGIFSFPVFTKQFCDNFIELLKDFESSSCPKGRPNTMNQYGVLLDELGLDDGLLTPLRQNYLQPISKLLFPDCGGGDLDSHKAFTVQYKLNEDKDLNYHFDNAEVTLNVSLGTQFTGGNLYFGAMRDVALEDTEMTECEHSPGIGIFHRGQHRHGAQPILSGERYNLIIWMRSFVVRNNRCPMCDKVPDLVETDGPGDGFTHSDSVNVCHLT